MNRIITIEGISGAGKSTLIDALINKNDSWRLVNELSSDFDALIDFPEFETETDAAIKANNWFLDREIERCKVANKYSKQYNVVADRWFYSILAVSYAREKIHGTRDKEQLYASIAEKLNHGSIFIPEVYILTVPVKVSLDRLNKRYNNDSSFLKKLNMVDYYLKHQNDFYQQIAQDFSFTLLDGIQDTSLLVNKLL